MSISFAPEQLHLVVLCEVTSNFPESEWVNADQASVAELLSRHYTHKLRQAYWTGGHIEAYEGLLDAVIGDVRIVCRAYWRFRKELNAYARGTCKMKVVREYRDLLIACLTPFEGGPRFFPEFYEPGSYLPVSATLGKRGTRPC